MTQSQKDILSLMDIGLQKKSPFSVGIAQFFEPDTSLTSDGSFLSFDTQLALVTHYALLKEDASLVSKYDELAQKLIDLLDNTPFEGVEIKHNIKITPDFVKHAFSKLMLYRTDRYYILTTANMDSANWDEISKEIDLIERRHGCQVIVNGVYSTLKYYLRLLKDPAEFLEHYVELLKADEFVKYPQQLAWNELISQ